MKILLREYKGVMMRDYKKQLLKDLAKTDENISRIECEIKKGSVTVKVILGVIEIAKLTEDVKLSIKTGLVVTPSL